MNKRRLAHATTIGTLVLVAGVSWVGLLEWGPLTATLMTIAIVIVFAYLLIRQ